MATTTRKRINVHEDKSHSYDVLINQDIDDDDHVEINLESEEQADALIGILNGAGVTILCDIGRYY